MRVLHIIDSLVAGGKERQFVELLRALKSVPDVVSHAVVMSNLVEYRELLDLDSDVSLLPRNSRYDVSMFPRLSRVMRRFAPDVVQSWNTMCSMYGAPLAKVLGAKFIDGTVRAAAGDLTLRDKDYFRSRLMLPFADAVVANSLAGLAAYRVPHEKAHCIYNGFDFGRISTLQPDDELRHELGIATRHIVGMTASFSQRKDYATFFEAATRVVSRRDDVTFVAIGTGEQLAGFRSAYPATRCLRIRLLGHRPDVESIVNLFSVGVLTTNASIHGEGVSNALMECMALGKPVIATDCGGNRELIEDRRCGFLIPNGDAGALTDRLYQLLDDEPLAREMGEQGRQRIRDHFSLERMTEDYMHLYRSLLAQH